MKRLICLFAASLVVFLCMSACSFESSGAEACKQYKDMQAVSSFREETSAKLKEIGEVVKDAENNKFGSDAYVKMAHLQAEVNVLCDNVIGLENYPAICSDLHQQTKGAAQSAKKIAEAYVNEWNSYYLGDVKAAVFYGREVAQYYQEMLLYQKGVLKAQKALEES